MTDLHYRSAVDLAALIRRKEVGALELLDHFLGRVATHNPALNAVIWMDEEGARARAREADAALARGEVWGPLHGVPMTIKECFDWVGSPTTWGIPEHRDNIATTDSAYVERMKAAGVTLFGKTNVPKHLADWQSFNEIYGTTNNPWDLGRTPGGSSGGSAAALAAGLTGIEAGSDIGASIRNPAHYCGVYGHKPTYGIVSPRGEALPGWVSGSDIAVVGPLARSAADLDVALQAVAGADGLDAAGWRLDLPPPRKTELTNLRIAVKLDDRNAPVDGPYKDRLQRTVDALARAGATVAEAEPDLDTDRVMDVYITLLRAATSTRVSDAEASRFQAIVDAQPDDPSYLARMARGNVLPHRKWLPLNNERTRMRHVWADFFRNWDLLLCPAASSHAFEQNQQGERQDRMIPINGVPTPSTEQMFWAGYTGVVYLPSTVAPIGLTEAGLPVGIQIVAPHLHDRSAIALAGMLETVIGGFQPPPGYEA